MARHADWTIPNESSYVPIFGVKPFVNRDDRQTDRRSVIRQGQVIFVETANCPCGGKIKKYAKEVCMKCHRTNKTAELLLEKAFKEWKTTKGKTAAKKTKDKSYAERRWSTKSKPD